MDSTNSDPIAMEYALHGRDRSCRPAAPERRPPLTRRWPIRRVRTVWFLRNTHDVSPSGWNARFDAELRDRACAATVHSYEPYSPLERVLMRRPDAPRYFHELIEYRR